MGEERKVNIHTFHGFNIVTLLIVRYHFVLPFLLNNVHPERIAPLTVRAILDERCRPYRRRHAEFPLAIPNRPEIAE